MAFLRVRAVWTGGAIGNGVTTLAFGSSTAFGVEEAASAVSVTSAFFQACQSAISASATVTISPSVEVVDPATGALLNELEVTPAPNGIVGAGNGIYAAGVGTSIEWRTTGITNGRRIRGRTFLVPAPAGVFDSNGTLVDSVRSTLAAAGGDLISDANIAGVDLKVWSRPSAPGAADGFTSDVTSARVADKASWLRTRRD